MHLRLLCLLSVLIALSIACKQSKSPSRTCTKWGFTKPGKGPKPFRSPIGRTCVEWAIVTVEGETKIVKANPKTVVVNFNYDVNNDGNKDFYDYYFWYADPEDIEKAKNSGSGSGGD